MTAIALRGDSGNFFLLLSNIQNEAKKINIEKEQNDNEPKVILHFGWTNNNLVYFTKHVKKNFTHRFIFFFQTNFSISCVTFKKRGIIWQEKRNV